MIQSAITETREVSRSENRTQPCNWQVPYSHAHSESLTQPSLDVLDTILSVPVTYMLKTELYKRHFYVLPCKGMKVCHSLGKNIA